MTCWMQFGLLRDLLHLHELVNGNLAFIFASVAFPELLSSTPLRLVVGGVPLSGPFVGQNDVSGLSE